MLRRIHQKQVLALYGAVLPFAMVDDMGWWTIPIVSLVIFTFYGIEGIGSQLEDPFGYDRNDIKMDAIVGDAKTEIDVVLDEWRRVRREMEGEEDVAGVGNAAQGLDGGVSPSGVRGFGGDAGAGTVFPPDLFLKTKPSSAD